MRTFTRFLTTAIVLAVIVPALRAQALVTAADLTRLETTAGEIETLAGTLSKTDPTQAADVRASLRDATEEISHLKVKLRKEGRVTREEYTALRDKLETLRIKAQGGSRARSRVNPSPATRNPPPSSFLSALNSMCGCRRRSIQGRRRSSNGSRGRH